MTDKGTQKGTRVIRPSAGVSNYLACMSAPIEPRICNVGSRFVTCLYAFVSIFLRVGWIVPFTIAGFYFGAIVLDSPMPGGTAESTIRELQ